MRDGECRCANSRPATRQAGLLPEPNRDLATSTPGIADNAALSLFVASTLTSCRTAGSGIRRRRRAESCYALTPTRRRTHAITKYAAAVAVMASARLTQKLQPARSSSGNTMNNTSEGRTSQKMLCAKAATGSLSPVSRYSQMKASSEVSGSEARSAAQSELRFAISETATITTADTTTLTMYGHMARAAPNESSKPARSATEGRPGSARA